MKEQNWPYLAGLIDGEGCLSAWKYWNAKRTDCAPYHQFSCRVSITNTSLYLMKWLVEHFGGGFLCKRESTEKHKASYEWRPKGQANTKRLLLAITPYLVIKKDQAKLLLEFIELETNPLRRSEIVDELHSLNRKGTVETNMSGTSSQEVKIESELS